MAERKAGDQGGRRLQPIGTDDEEVDVGDDDASFSAARREGANEDSRGFQMKPLNTFCRGRHARRRVQPLEEAESDEGLTRGVPDSPAGRVIERRLETKVRERVQPWNKCRSFRFRLSTSNGSYLLHHAGGTELTGVDTNARASCAFACMLR